MEWINWRKSWQSKPRIVSYIIIHFYFIIAEASLGSLVRGNSFRSSNRSIDSINNSLIEDNKYNVKKHWMSDRGEIHGREVPQGQLNSIKFSAMNNMGGQNRLEQQPYSNSNYLQETAFSQSSMKRTSSIAYGSDGLAFGVIPKEIVDQIEDNKSDWHARCSAFEIIYSIIEEASSLRTLAPYSPSFIKYISNFLNSETNSKIISNILKLINKVLELDKVNGQTLVPLLVKKLADSNIQIRQLVIKSFLMIMKNLKQTTYLNMIIPYLGSTSWHIREEVLHLIMVSFLKNTNDFDYFSVIDSIAKLLDDQKSTVRFTCRETLAALVIKGQKNRVTEVLYELVESKEYNRLCDRFDLGSCPRFYEDSLVFEFPIHSNESRSRASSRGSTFSESSRRSGKSTRSKIGNSPLTFKGFETKKNVSSIDKDYGGFTVADNYKHGPTPSERMMKFNSSPVPLAKNNKGPDFSSDYNNIPANKSQFSATSSEKPKDVTQNLRLLKNKIRVGSASSHDSEPYKNIPVENSSNNYPKRNENIFRKNVSNPMMNSFEDSNGQRVRYLIINNRN